MTIINDGRHQSAVVLESSPTFSKVAWNNFLITSIHFTPGAAPHWVSCKSDTWQTFPSSKETAFDQTHWWWPTSKKMSKVIFFSLQKTFGIYFSFLTTSSVSNSFCHVKSFAYHHQQLVSSIWGIFFIFKIIGRRKWHFFCVSYHFLFWPHLCGVACSWPPRTWSESDLNWTLRSVYGRSLHPAPLCQQSCATVF